MTSEAEVLSLLKPSKLLQIMNDPEKSAKAVQLIYTTDSGSKGITRKRIGKKYSYYLEGKKITDHNQITRINKLVLPPAWREVWICTLENGHLQATGKDARNRKQYRYHAIWNAMRNHTKFYRMLQFGSSLPTIRQQLEKDLALRSLCKRKVLAIVVSLMERTNIRIGNSVYEKLYGSFGLTTLKDRHISVTGEKIHFSFKGKKGIYHDINLRHRKLAKAIQNCKDIPGKELFQYYDEDGNRHPIDSGMVNNYIKEISNEDFTAKDFRTWSGTVNALLAFREIGNAENEKEKKDNMRKAVDLVAGQLGNTPAVCRKYYIHPLLINLYENASIQKYTDALDAIEENDGKTGLTQEERIIMKILETEKIK